MTEVTIATPDQVKADLTANRLLATFSQTATLLAEMTHRDMGLFEKTGRRTDGYATYLGARYAGIIGVDRTLAPNLEQAIKDVLSQPLREAFKRLNFDYTTALGREYDAFCAQRIGGDDASVPAVWEKLANARNALDKVRSESIEKAVRLVTNGHLRPYDALVARMVLRMVKAVETELATVSQCLIDVRSQSDHLSSAYWSDPDLVSLATRRLQEEGIKVTVVDHRNGLMQVERLSDRG